MVVDHVPPAVLVVAVLPVIVVDDVVVVMGIVLIVAVIQVILAVAVVAVVVVAVPSCPGPYNWLSVFVLATQNRLPDLTPAPEKGCQTLPWPPESIARPSSGPQNRLPDNALPPKNSLPYFDLGP